MLLFISMNKKKTYKLPLCLSQVEAGFPSPADDFLESSLDLNDYLIDNPLATFLVKVSGYSMTGAGILPGDILVVDRSLEAQHNRIVVAVVDGELTVKRFLRQKSFCQLVSDNPRYPAIKAQDELLIWGVVVAVVRKMRA